MGKNIEDGYIKFLRGFIFLISVFLWFLSIGWSAEGFSIDNPELYWIGIGLALSVTGAELLFNRGAKNPTIFFVGLAAYIFGFATNFIGIASAVGIDFTSFSDNPLRVVASSLGVAALAIIVEAAPESFLLWSLYPEMAKPGDFISSLFSGANLPNKGPSRPTKQPFNRSNGYPNSFKRPENGGPQERSGSENVSSIERTIFAYITQYRSRNKNKMPSYAQVVQNTPLTTKSQVKPYFDKYKKQFS